MESLAKPIVLSAHACEQARYRGCSAEETIAAIRTAEWTAAERGRWECRQDLSFNGLWNGRLYQTRQIRPIFVDEPAEIVVVTVYVYYF